MKLIDKLVDKNIIKRKDTDLYEYSINILRNYIFFSIIIILGNLFTKNYFTTILFLFLFFSLRKYCGGLHFNHKSICLVFSIIVTLTVPILSNHVFIPSLHIVLLQLILTIILILFPVIEIPQKHITYEENKYYKSVSINLLICIFVINCVCLIFNLYKISNIILFSIVLTLFSVFFGYLKYMNN